jgi:hypothetical protein
MKATLREIIEKYNLDVRLTPNQNIILCGIRKAWKRPITTALAQAGLLVRFFHFWCPHYLLSGYSITVKFSQCCEIFPVLSPLINMSRHISFFFLFLETWF